MIVGFENEFIDDIIFWSIVLFSGFSILIILDMLGGWIGNSKK